MKISNFQRAVPCYFPNGVNPRSLVLAAFGIFEPWHHFSLRLADCSTVQGHRGNHRRTGITLQLIWRSRGSLGSIHLVFSLWAGVKHIRGFCKDCEAVEGRGLSINNDKQPSIMAGSLRKLQSMMLLPCDVRVIGDFNHVLLDNRHHSQTVILSNLPAELLWFNLHGSHPHILW